MSQSSRTSDSGPSDAVTETALPPLLALSAVLVVGWSTWALVVRPHIPRASPPVETIIGIAARTVFWLVPCAVYLWRYWGARWYQPLGLGFPLGRTQIARTIVLTLVVAALLFVGTSTQQNLAVTELVLRFLARMRFEPTAPLFEELVFRGLLLGELINWVRDASSSGVGLRLRFWGSLVFSALVFTLVHWPSWLSHVGLAVTLERTAPVFVTGVILGFVFAHTRSVWACVFLHWLNNQLSHLGG